MYDSIVFGEKGQDITLYPYIVFANPQNIYLKSNVIISEFCWLHGGIKTVIGNFIHIASHCSISGGGLCILEDFVGLSAGVRLITGSEMLKGEGLTNPTIPAKYRSVYRSFVHLQKHSFLSTNVVVHPGITIGEGAVVASNSVVTKDVKPWTINAGNPTRVIAERESEKIRFFERSVYVETNTTPLDVNDFLDLKINHEFVPKYS
ncbi:acyltransferase [Pseudanabaena sp. FACHB-1998]|uniref:acyltransferase n=1 Tax=Pseudanabaena sp. FACHB-1998 TaxID=2692858 RepID=UPI0016819B26|nr:acyltransferase [Pseudanabaena sp. FACHB-1998]MBD2178833.1 acyltransferase [Pseudanabaena sp. FACHB-1998]